MTDQALDGLSPPSHVDDSEQHKADLLEQFYLTLQVTYMAAPQLKSAVNERIERLFDSVHSWRNAYEIEQLLCFVISDQQLETELSRRLAEAHTLKMDFVDVIDKELQPGTVPPVDKRIVLHRLLNDLQWFYSKRVQHRAASKRLMVRVSLLFMVALATFSLVLFIQFFAHGPATASAAATAKPGAPSQGATVAVSAPTTNQAPEGQPETTGGAK